VLEGDETPQQTALRELHEETGLEPTGPLRLVGVDRILRGSQQLINLSFACQCARGDVRLSAEHQEFAWVRPSDYSSRIAAALDVLPDENLKAVTSSILAGLDEYLAR
jgi:8-oxo-dGTP pyrophosphatase MutT (NUDIX family)